MDIILIATTLAVMVVNWWSRQRSDDRLEAWSKPVVTLLVMGVALAGDAPWSHRLLAAVALLFCLGGDIALLPAIDRFVVGLASFLVGHLVFIALFVTEGLTRPWLGAVALVATTVLATVVGGRVVRGAKAHDPALAGPVVAYLAVICAMAVIGWSTGRPWVLVGSTLFVVSDSILGWRQFVSPRRWMPVAVMVTYHGAILALALSLWRP